MSDETFYEIKNMLDIIGLGALIILPIVFVSAFGCVAFFRSIKEDVILKKFNKWCEDKYSDKLER